MIHSRDIHKHLDRSEVRDFLAQEYEQSTQDANSHVSVADLEAEIEKLQALLIHARRHQAVCELLEAQGWQAWHIDIYNILSYDEDVYFPFVGTEEECEALVQAEEESDVS